MKIGAYEVSPFRPDMPILTLAPLAGVNNRAFRLLCARLGARIVGTEFINCRLVPRLASQNSPVLDFSDAAAYARTGMSLLAAQLYGNDPSSMAAGAGELEKRGAQIIDINFGCSVPHLVRKGCGAAYLQDLDRLYQAVRQTASAVGVPVTVKTRIGWDPGSIVILEVVRQAQAAGAQAIAIHARTVVQGYQGKADWSWIARAKEIASIPVLGNGDVFCYQDALAMHRQTGCDAVMIGRAAMANPWIFSARSQVSLAERIDLALDQLAAMATCKGERTGLLETRKHLALYFKGLPRASPLRHQLLTTESYQHLIELLMTWRQTPPPVWSDTDLTLSASEARDLAWGGRG